MRKIKLMIFVILIILFIIALFLGIFGTSLSYLNLDEIKQNRKLKNDLVSSFKINNIATIYDKNNNIFYYNISENYVNSDIVFNLQLDPGYKYKIVNKKINIIKVNYDKPVDIVIYNDKYFFETKIQFTNLPLVKIKIEDSIVFEDINGIFTYINSGDEKKVLTSNTKIHIRGSSSKYLDKKSYKLKMYNKKYTNEKDVNFSDFYNGSDFILDSVYKDPSKVRNLLSTELWNDISNDFTNIDIYSEFVELFINNEYKGLYLLTEPINRKKLNLKKSNNDNTSIIIKANEKIEIDNNVNINKISTDIFSNHELKYPNDEELYEDVWRKFLLIVNNYYDEEKILYKDVINTFDLNNYIDIIIFNAFINNIDNRLVRNNYFYMNSLNDKKIYIQPWDMEISMGLLFSELEERFVLKNLQDYNQIYTKFYHEDAPEINKLLLERYWELRKNILTNEYFDKLLDKYKSELCKGATLRDSKLWYEYDVEVEIEEIRTWIYNRIEYFDKYVESLANEEC